MSVWILTVTHKHGDNVSAHTTEFAANKALQRFVESWWGYELAGEEMPRDPEAMVDRYFEKMMDSESYAIIDSEVTDEEGRIAA